MKVPLRLALLMLSSLFLTGSYKTLEALPHRIMEEEIHYKIYPHYHPLSIKARRDSLEIEKEEKKDPWGHYWENNWVIRFTPRYIGSHIGEWDLRSYMDYEPNTPGKWTTKIDRHHVPSPNPDRDIAISIVKDWNRRWTPEPEEQPQQQPQPQPRQDVVAAVPSVPSEKKEKVIPDESVPGPETTEETPSQQETTTHVSVPSEPDISKVETPKEVDSTVDTTKINMTNIETPRKEKPVDKTKVEQPTTVDTDDGQKEELPKGSIPTISKPTVPKVDKPETERPETERPEIEKPEKKEPKKKEPKKIAPPSRPQPERIRPLGPVVKKIERKTWLSVCGKNVTSRNCHRSWHSMWSQYKLAGEDFSNRAHKFPNKAEEYLEERERHLNVAESLRLTYLSEIKQWEERNPRKKYYSERFIDGKWKWTLIKSK